MGTMSVEEIIANAPEGAELYWVWHDGDISYYKQSESGDKWHRLFSPYGDSLSNEWCESATYWDEATPLPKPAYSAENQPPDGWVGESRVFNSSWRKTFIHEGKIYLAYMGEDIKSKHQFRETPTPREKFIEQAQREGVDFGEIYNEFIGGEV